MQRVFEAFGEGASCHGIAEDLNRDGVPAFSGGRWYALTVRRMLLNETYTGRTIYRRTRVQKIRDAARGRWVSRVSERDESEWIEVEGVTPPIVSPAVFARAQARLTDPERRRRSLPSRAYALRGRLRCAECGAAMVGHAVNRAQYHYYRCSNGSSGPGETRCPSRYIRVGRIEEAVKAALSDLLASPERLLDEARQAAAEKPVVDRGLAQILRELDEIEGRQRRLVQLFTRGELPEDILSAESKSLAERRAALEAQRSASESAQVTPRIDIARIRRDLPAALLAIRTWIETAGEDDFDLLLRAVDVQIVASGAQIEMRGSVPLIAEMPQSFATIERTSA